jgi:hypothetical protein
MQDHITVGVRHDADVAIDTDTAQRHPVAGSEGMDVVTVTNPHQ